jgi:hypothetical protein
VLNLGFGLQGLEYRVGRCGTKGSGFRVWGSRIRVWAQGLEFGV